MHVQIHTQIWCSTGHSMAQILAVTVSAYGTDGFTTEVILFLSQCPVGEMKLAKAVDRLFQYILSSWPR